MPKFNKTKGFSLKSGNKPTFQQMGSGSPLDKTLIGNQKNLPDHLRAKIEDAPGKMYDTPGKMYNAPLKAEDEKEEETTEDGDKKEPVKPKDKLGVKIAKIAANAAIGGFDAATGSKTARPTINFGPEKAEEEIEALNTGQKALQSESFVSTYSPKKEDGTYKTAEEYDAEFAAFNAKKK
mgnify:CR=1 FL=1